MADLIAIQSSCAESSSTLETRKSEICRSLARILAMGTIMKSHSLQHQIRRMHPLSIASCSRSISTQIVEVLPSAVREAERKARLEVFRAERLRKKEAAAAALKIRKEALVQRRAENYAEMQNKLSDQRLTALIELYHRSAGFVPMEETSLDNAIAKIFRKGGQAGRPRFAGLVELSMLGRAALNDAASPTSSTGTTQDPISQASKRLGPGQFYPQESRTKYGKSGSRIQQTLDIATGTSASGWPGLAHVRQAQRARTEPREIESQSE